ncbi:MAG: efflux RND transporter periplasmic adaptor subunit [Bacteroides sp.]|jgi:RND family efflux transporter MFP subunit|nr:efflux RND transporter periplasmic adaptor subunit [Bacteroides sp.]
MKQISLFLGLVSAFVFFSCSNGTYKKEEKYTVKIDTLSFSDGQVDLQFPGRVKPAQDVNIAFRVPGTIQKIFVDEGGYMRKGQLLAELDPTDYKVQLQATEAEYKQVKAEAGRVVALYKDKGTTPNNYDKAVYGLQQIKAKYKNHKDELAYTRLYAPFSGYVHKHLFKEYESVSAGMPILSVISDETPEVEINLPAVEYIKYKEFSSYTCTFDVYPGITFDLKLIHVTPKANANQLYTMRLKLIDLKGKPMPTSGMNTMVTISYRQAHDHIVSVSNGALFQRNGKSMVYVYNPQTGTVAAHGVSVHKLKTNGQAIISATGLKSGDLIVTSGVHTLKDGDPVSPIAKTSETNVGGLL